MDGRGAWRQGRVNAWGGVWQVSEEGGREEEEEVQCGCVAVARSLLPPMMLWGGNLNCAQTSHGCLYIYHYISIHIPSFTP